MALLFGLWFLVVGVAPGVAACPTHQLTAAASTSAHRAHMAHAMPSHDHGTPAGQHHSHDCTCPGSCCSVAALAVSAPDISFIEVVRFTVAPSVFKHSAPREWTDFLLPYPTPPPSSATAA